MKPTQVLAIMLFINHFLYWIQFKKLSLAPDNYLDGKRILTQNMPHNVRKRVPKGATPRKAARKALPFEYITDDFKKELHLVALYKTTPILLGKREMVLGLYENLRLIIIMIEPF